MKSPPDIVLVMTDQQRYDQVGHRSDGFYETPALDRLAREGVMFANAYSSATTCVPARIGLLTGLQARRVPRMPGTFALREGVWTIAHTLREVGYETALVGKMHFTPMHAHHGFDVMRTSEHLGASRHALRPDGGPDLDDYHQWLVDNGVAKWQPFDVGDPPAVEPIRPAGAGTSAFPFLLEYHATTWIEQEVRSYLASRRNERPMFLVISFPHPHAPLNPPQPYASMYDEADVECPTMNPTTNATLPDAFIAALHGGTPRFAGWRVAEHGVAALRSRLTKARALIRQIDDALGRLLVLLPRDRTLITFTSDHGDFGGHHGLAGKVPWIPFDDLVRVPLVVAGAGVDGGRTVTSLVQSSDLALTFCDLAGVGPPVPLEEFDSVPLTRHLRDDPGTGQRERAMFFVSNLGWPGARAGPLKLICHSPSGSRAAFDLVADPDESCNVADDPAYRDPVETLGEMVRAQMERPAPPSPFFDSAARR